MKGNSYDTRFLIELYYSGKKETQRKIAGVLASSAHNYLCAVVISEVYQLTLAKEGKEAAEVRTQALCKDFRVVNVDSRIAVKAAMIRHTHKVPLADSMIAATSVLLRVPVYTDDPHFRTISELLVRWI